MAHMARLRHTGLSIFKPSEIAWRLGKCDQTKICLTSKARMRHGHETKEEIRHGLHRCIRPRRAPPGVRSRHCQRRSAPGAGAAFAGTPARAGDCAGRREIRRRHGRGGGGRLARRPDRRPGGDPLCPWLPHAAGARIGSIPPGAGCRRGQSSGRITGSGARRGRG